MIGHKTLAFRRSVGRSPLREVITSSLRACETRPPPPQAASRTVAHNEKKSILGGGDRRDTDINEVTRTPMDELRSREVKQTSNTFGLLFTLGYCKQRFVRKISSQNYRCCRKLLGTRIDRRKMQPKVPSTGQSAMEG